MIPSDVKANAKQQEIKDMGLFVRATIFKICNAM